MDMIPASGVVSEAILQSTVIEIEYVSSSGQETTRIVEPVHRDETLFWGYCRLRSDWRSFRIDRIRKISLRPESITPRPIPSDLTRFPWQASGKPRRQRPLDRRRTSSYREYATGGSGCALVMVVPFLSLIALLFVGVLY